MAKPKRFSVGGYELQFCSQKELKDKVFALADDVIKRLAEPIVVMRVPWNQGTTDYEGYLIQPAPADSWNVYKFGREKAPRCIALHGGSRDEVLYTYLRHEAWTWLDPEWDLDSHKRYRDIVQKWVKFYLDEGEAITFAAEIDNRRRELIAWMEERRR